MLECELLDRRKFQTKAEAGKAIFGFIEGWYSPGQRHSALGYMSPINLERSLHAQQAGPVLRAHGCPATGREPPGRRPGEWNVNRRRSP